MGFAAALAGRAGSRDVQTSPTRMADAGVDTFAGYIRSPITDPAPGRRLRRRPIRSRRERRGGVGRVAGSARPSGATCFDGRPGRRAARSSGVQRPAPVRSVSTTVQQEPPPPTSPARTLCATSTRSSMAIAPASWPVSSTTGRRRTLLPRIRSTAAAGPGGRPADHHGDARARGSA